MLPPATPEPRRRGLFLPTWLAVVVALLLVGGLGFFVGWAVTPGDNDSSRAAGAEKPSNGSTPSPTAPSSPPTTTAPGTSGLSEAGLGQDDLGQSFGLVLIPGGNRVSGEPTLDLCNGTFASESSRRARFQVAAVDAQENVALSTETVQYANGAATVQAFDELRSVAASCPSTPVTSPVGEAAVTTTFNAAPDGTWPQVSGVERLAFDFDTKDGSGQNHHSLAVYLRRGRVLMGVYFSQPDGPQTAVAGQSTVAGIVDLFAKRMAQLPDSLVND
jgi:hypothetical protein